MRTEVPAAVLAILLAVLLPTGCSDSEEMLSPPVGGVPCNGLENLDDLTENRFRACVPDNGTVFDTDTGLIWLKNGDCFGLRDFEDAGSAAADLADGACGLNDDSTAGSWRLPTQEEWEAIVLDEAACPIGYPHLPDAAGDPCWSEDDAFTGVQPSGYWSSTNGNNENYAWIVYLHDSYYIPDVKTDLHYAWPVQDSISP